MSSFNARIASLSKTEQKSLMCDTEEAAYTSGGSLVPKGHIRVLLGAATYRSLRGCPARAERWAPGSLLEEGTLTARMTAGQGGRQYGDDRVAKGLRLGVTRLN